MIITIYLAMAMVALVGMVTTPQAARATNKSSYKHGFNNAVEDYSTCQGSHANDEGCGYGDYEPPYSVGAVASCSNSTMTANATIACEDGYINGGKHWCMTDTKDCASLTTSGNFPGQLINRKSLADVVTTWNDHHPHPCSNGIGLGGCGPAGYDQP